MAGIEIEFELRDAEARQRLQSIFDRLEHPAPLLASIGQILADSTRARFRTGTYPDGKAWQPQAPATIRARSRRGRSQNRILDETGTLVGTVRHQVTGDRVEIGASTPYAAIHQLGGTIAMPARDGTVYLGRKRKDQAGRRVAKKKNKTTEARAVKIGAYSITIPARPYLGVSAADEVAILQAARDELAGVY